MKNSKRWKAALMAAALGASLILGGCQEKENTVDKGQKEETVQVKVGTWKTAQTIQPFFYQQFTDEKYEIEVAPFTNPGDQKAALLAGELDMTGIVSSLCNKCSALVVGKDSDIQTEADLKGKTIAYVPGTMHHALLLDVLERAGLNPETDVELVRIDFFDMGQALQDGKIDAFCSGEPYPSEAIVKGYGRVLNYPYFDDSIDTINAAMIVTEDTIKENPELVQDLVNAHLKASDYLTENKDETFIEHTKNLAQKMKELGIINEVPDVDAMFNLTFLENADKS